MSNKEPGYVYILINPSFHEDRVKIGKISNSITVLYLCLVRKTAPVPANKTFMR